MTKHLLYLLLFFNISLYGQFSNINKGIPTFHGSSVNLNYNEKLLDIYNKTQLHISNKADSMFIKRMKLKENDSIQFKLSYLVDKFGYVVLDSTKTDSGIPSFDNYIKLIIGSLPKFTPALDLIKKEYRKHKISLVSEFVVKNKKLMLFENNKVPDFKEPVFPIFESCAKNSTDKRNCQTDTYKTIATSLDVSKIFIPESVTEIKLMIGFIIDENGKASNIEILRSSIQSDEFKKKVIRTFLNLPKFYIPENEPNFHKKKFSLPITIQISGGGYMSHPYRNSRGFY